MWLKKSFLHFLTLNVTTTTTSGSLTLSNTFEPQCGSDWQAPFRMIPSQSRQQTVNACELSCFGAMSVVPQVAALLNDTVQMASCR